MRSNLLSLSVLLSLCFAGISFELEGQEIFDPTPYLSVEDLPDDFCEECQLEDFEDAQIDDFLSFDCGEILLPNIEDPRIPGVQITDSVDGDDGEIDGSGNGGHSYFCVDPSTSVRVNFANPVAAAGAVWTDGDRGVAIQIEAFDIDGNLLAASEPVAVADTSFFGETEEDRFLGIQSELGISAIQISTIGQGAGIEIDHVTWDSRELADIPDPIAPTIDQICSAAAVSSDDLSFDIDGDGQVTQADIVFALEELGTRPGDLDLDGSVVFADFLAISQAFGSTTSNYTDGDIDCNGEVAFADFLVLSQNFGFVADGGGELATVPEPSSELLFSILLLLTCQLGRTRRTTT